MIINDRNIKTWSLIGQRATFGLVALEVVKEREELLILTSDVSTSAGLDRFRKNHPNNFSSGLVKRVLLTRCQEY